MQNPKRTLLIGFVVALLFGALFYSHFSEVLGSAATAKNSLKIVENIGIIRENKKESKKVEKSS
mgnify:CR=1 FL=1